MANLNRRAALIGAALSSTALAFPAGSLVRAKEPETVHFLAQRLQAALEQDGRAWHDFLAKELSLALADSPLRGFDAIVEPADDGEPVACFSTRNAEAKMNRHLNAFIRLAKELDPTITSGWVQLDPNVEGHGIHVVALRRDPADPVLQGSRNARRIA